MSFEDYERICESDEFENILSAYADSKNKPQAESLAACEDDANVSSYGMEHGVVYMSNAVVQPDVDSYETESLAVCEGNADVPSEVDSYGTESID